MMRLVASGTGAAVKPQVDEELLNRAYVHAMQKHGARPPGDPYFHPLKSPRS
jgi:guanosine-3',5'-bis(diphosphate) 3'-pyrophosphohydrolase